MWCLLRVCVLVVCLAGLLSVALGAASVQWHIYSDLLCSVPLTNNEDPDAFYDVGNTTRLTVYSSLCFPLTGVTGIHSATAGCTTGTADGADYTSSGLVLYTDYNCTTFVTEPNVVIQGLGGCAAISPFNQGRLSARVNCQRSSAASRAATSLSLLVLLALLAAFAM